MSRTDIYAIWNSMIMRCENPNAISFPSYGGRGIRVCDLWRHDFAAFFTDMGPRPSKNHSLDRYPNKNGHYEPGNVRWATGKQQQRNRRINRILSTGETLAEAAERTAMPYEVLRHRLLAGWSDARALHTPYVPLKRSAGTAGDQRT